jgi:hypothetical protein
MALVIENTFTSMQDLCNYLSQKYLNIRLFENEDYFINMKFESNKLIKHINSSIFIVYGSNDHVVPSFMSSSLFDLAVNAKYKELCELTSRGHNDLYEEDSYYEKLKKMLKSVC